MVTYMRETQKLGAGTIETIIKQGFPSPKKHIHRHLKGIKIYAIEKV